MRIFILSYPTKYIKLIINTQLILNTKKNTIGEKT